MMGSGNFQSLMLPKYRKVFFDAYDEMAEQYSDVFNMDTSKKSKEYDYHVSGTGLWETKEPGGTISEEEIDVGDEVTYTHVAYAKMITIERELADDEQYGVMEKLPKKLGRGGRAVVETVSANILNNSFTVAGYDDSYLIGSDHPLINSSSTVSNLMTTAALSDTTIKEGITSMRTDMLTEEGLKMQATAKKLILPPDLEFTALTILQSMGQSNTANNATNVVKGRLAPVVMDYLTSTTAYWFMDPMLNELRFFWRVKPEFKSAENFDNMVAKYRGYLRFSVGYSDWRGWIGNLGA